MNWKYVCTRRRDYVEEMKAIDPRFFFQLKSERAARTLTLKSNNSVIVFARGLISKCPLDVSWTIIGLSLLLLLVTMFVFNNGFCLNMLPLDL